MNRMVASRLFLEGTHREAVGAVVVVQRAHVRRVEAQVATEVRRVRNGRPIVAVAADAVQRARRVGAIARSRKEDRTARRVITACAVHLVAIKYPSAVRSKIIRRSIRRIILTAIVRPAYIIPVIGESGKSVRRRQMIPDGRRIVNRLNHRIVVGRRHRIVGAP